MSIHVVTRLTISCDAPDAVCGVNKSVIARGFNIGFNTNGKQRNEIKTVLIK